MEAFYALKTFFSSYSKPAIIEEYFLCEPIKTFACKYVPVSKDMWDAEGWTLGLFIICKQEAIIPSLLWRSDLALCWPVWQDIKYKVNSFLCVSTQKTRYSGRLGQSLVISMKKAINCGLGCSILQCWN